MCWERGRPRPQSGRMLPSTAGGTPAFPGYFLNPASYSGFGTPITQ